MGYTETQAKEFIEMIAPLMVAEGHKRGYTVISTAIAQAIIEGACGTSKLAKAPYYNHFGLKAGSTWLKAGKPAVNMKTKEEYTVGKLTTINDYFRAYPNGNAEGVAGYYDFISTKRYANLKTARNYIEYANMLKIDGYATSSTYISTLCKTVVKYDLTKYDLEKGEQAFAIGETYTTTSDLYIRTAPDGERIKFECITLNAKAHSSFDDFGNAILKKGTKVTCKDVKYLASSTWLKIPSGWICANTKGENYIV